MLRKIVFICCFLVLLSACTLLEDDEYLEPMETELNILVSETGRAPTVRHYYINEYIKEFKKNHPNVTVNLYTIPEEHTSMDDIMQDYQPDLMEVTPFILNHYLEYFTDLEGYVEMDRVDLDDFYPVLLEHSKVKGQLKSIPYHYLSFLFFYNKDVLDQANLDYPTADWTWEEALNYSTILAGANAQHNHGVGISSFGERPFLHSYMQGMGLLLMSEEDGAAQGYLDSMSNVEGLEWFASSFENTNCGCLFDSLVDQEVGILYDATNNFSIVEANESIGAVGMPRWQGNESANFMWLSSMAIPETSSNKDVAWDFISELLVEDNDISQEIAQQLYVSTRKSVSASSGMDQHQIGSVLVEALDYATPDRFLNHFNIYLDSNSILLGIYEGRPVAPILRAVAQDWDQQLREGGFMDSD